MTSDQMSMIQPRTKLAILNLNLRFGLADDGPNNWSNRKTAYPLLLERHPCDFYTFQEANNFQVAYLAGQLPRFKSIGERRPAPEQWQSNLIFYHPRWRCLFSDHFYLSETPDTPSKFSKSRWPRQCTLGLFEFDTNRILVATTHFDFDPEVQRLSAMLIAKRLEHRGRSYPVVLTGDFNAELESSAYSVLTSSTGGFKNAFKPSCSGTYHGFSGTASNGMIDWILYRGPLTVENAFIIKTQFNNIYPSDHFPLVAHFKLQTNKASKQDILNCGRS